EGVRGAEQDALVVRVEEAAGRLSRAGRHAAQPRAVDVHDELLIARAPVPRTLKDETSSVRAEIRLGVLSSCRELADVAEMPLTRLGGDGDERRGWRRPRAGERTDEQQGELAQRRGHVRQCKTGAHAGARSRSLSGGCRQGAVVLSDSRVAAAMVKRSRCDWPFSITSTALRSG